MLSGACNKFNEYRIDLAPVISFLGTTVYFLFPCYYISGHTDSFIPNDTLLKDDDVLLNAVT